MQVRLLLAQPTQSIRHLRTTGELLMSKRNEAINEVYELILGGEPEQAFYAARALREVEAVDKSKKVQGFK